jgi:hypothetical protein
MYTPQLKRAREMLKWGQRVPKAVAKRVTLSLHVHPRCVLIMRMVD